MRTLLAIFKKLSSNSGDSLLNFIKLLCTC